MKSIYRENNRTLFYGTVLPSQLYTWMILVNIKIVEYSQGEPNTI